MKTMAILACLMFVSPANTEDVSWGMKGWAFTESGEYDKALEAYEKCIKEGQLSSGSLARTKRNIGITYRRMGKPEDAISHFCEAILLVPDDIYMDFLNRGNSFSDMEKYDQALCDYLVAEMMVPQYGEVNYNRGIVYERLNHADKAREQFIIAHKKGVRSGLLKERFTVYKVNWENPDKPVANGSDASAGSK